MCGRFRIQDQPSDEKLAELFQQAIEISLKLGAKMVTSGDVRPTDIAPVLAPSARNRALGAFPMQWGVTHPKRGMLVFNTRMETAQEKGQRQRPPVPDPRGLLLRVEEDRPQAEGAIRLQGGGRVAPGPGGAVHPHFGPA